MPASKTGGTHSVDCCYSANVLVLKIGNFVMLLQFTLFCVVITRFRLDDMGASFHLKCMSDDYTNNCVSCSSCF